MTTDDFEMPAAYSETTRTARKAHKCCECDETIHPRERYHYASGIWDGDPLSYKTCALCDHVRQMFDVWIYGSLQEQFVEALRDGWTPDDNILPVWAIEAMGAR